MKTYSQFIEEAEERIEYVRLHHGSDEDSVKSIKRTGPRPSAQGSEGPGHYVTPDIKKAEKYAEFTSKQRKKNPAVVSYRVPKNRVTTTDKIPRGVTSQQKTSEDKPVVRNVRTGHVVMDPNYAKEKMILKTKPIIRRKR